MSKALAKSKRTTSTGVPFSKLAEMKSSVSSRFVVHDLFLTKPCCCLANNLNLYKKISSFCLIMPSIILHAIDVSETGR